MNWFLSKLVFQVFCGAGDHAPQFDEQLRLIYAEDKLHAFHKARLLGEGDCLGNESINCIPVKWKFIDVTELHPLLHCTDGAEISSVIKEEADAALYIRSVQRRARQLLQHGLQEFIV
jgi:Domain of unknown function (DUF4288)